jgi:hypothetical protein
MMTSILTSMMISTLGAPAPDAELARRPVRVLLAAGGPTREYQFVRTLFVRETELKRAELSIYLQGIRKGEVVQDVPEARLLKLFPDRLRSLDHPKEKQADPHLNLRHYDVVIAFDVDWTQLSAEQLRLLEKWVSLEGGGLIMVAGPLHAHHLSRPAHKELLKPILEICPVVPGDSRIIALNRTPSEPCRLNFDGATADMTFLRLDAERGDPLAGWEDFFTGPRVVGKKPALQRGFYNFYPVERVKAGATVIATFSDLGAGQANHKEHPFLVTLPHGKGRVVWLGSGEMWRLRLHRVEFYDRFWTLLARYAGSLPVQASEK